MYIYIIYIIILYYILYALANQGCFSVALTLYFVNEKRPFTNISRARLGAFGKNVYTFWTFFVAFCCVS